MNNYQVRYFENGFQKIIKDIKTREEAEKIQQEKNLSPFGSIVYWREIIPDDIKPYKDTRSIKEYVPGNVVKVVKPFHENKDSDEYVDKFAIVVGSYATLCSFGRPTSDNNFHEYQLAFLDGESSAWWYEDRLEFIAIGDPILLNMWLRKYASVNADDSIMLVDEIKKIEERRIK